MADLPQQRTILINRHEWVIGDEYAEYITARTLRDGIFFAQQQMEKMGIDMSYDDAYKVRAGDGASIILYVDQEEED